LESDNLKGAGYITAEEMGPHTEDDLVLAIKLVNREFIKGTLTMFKPKRIVVKGDDGRELKIFKHSILYCED